MVEINVNDLEVKFEVVTQKAKDLIKRDEKVLFIIKTVREYTGSQFSDLSVKSRIRELTMPRQLIFSALRIHTDYPLSAIGSLFKRDHATVIYSKRTILNLAQYNKKFAVLWDNIIDDIVNFKENKC